MDTQTVLIVLGIAVPVMVAFVAGYVKRGREQAVRDAKIDQLVREAEDGRRIHREMCEKITTLVERVATLEGHLRSGRKV